MEKQIEKKPCKNCIHYQGCVDTFRKAKQDGEVLLIEEDAYFADAGDCDFYADERIYRKQSDTAKEIFAEIGKILTAKYNSIQADCHHRMRFGNVDTPQGMKELGELSGVRQVIAEIKAFEKKYMEDNDAESN